MSYQLEQGNPQDESPLDALEGTTEHPIWRAVAKEMIATGALQFGRVWPTEHFEEALRCRRDSPEFDFAMMHLRNYVEKKTGYYLESMGNGTQWRIPEGYQHESVSHRFDRKMMRYSRRSIAMRTFTLANPTAGLTEEQRATMQRNLEHASIRHALLHRAKAVTEIVRTHAPKLLPA